MKIDTNKGLTIVIGKNANVDIRMVYETLRLDKNYQVYGVERYSTNVRNYAYNYVQNDLRYISDNLRYSNNKNPFIVFLPEFDFVQNLTEIKRIKDLIKTFIKNAPIPVHVYLVASTYEMCRDEEVLIFDTGKIIRFSDYEEYRTIKMNLEVD